MVESSVEREAPRRLVRAPAMAPLMGLPSAQAVLRAYRNGLIPAIRLGHAVLFDPDAVLRHLATRAGATARETVDEVPVNPRKGRKRTVAVG
jgi:glutathione S-transferase